MARKHDDCPYYVSITESEKERKEYLSQLRQALNVERVNLLLKAKQEVCSAPQD
jgi:hypothetical protein